MSDVEEELEEGAESLDADGPLDPDEAELGEDEEMEDLEDEAELGDLDDETRHELAAVDEVLSQKEQNARSLAIRRELERRAEEKQFHDDLDYLDD